MVPGYGYLGLLTLLLHLIPFLQPHIITSPFSFIFVLYLFFFLPFISSDSPQPLLFLGYPLRLLYQRNMAISQMNISIKDTERIIEHSFFYARAHGSIWATEL